MVRYFGGGILGALHILKEHWGAVERDLAAAHWSMADMLAQLPLSQFISFVLYAPPGTAVFHLLNEGWTATTHKVTDLIEWTKMQLCTSAEDPERAWDQMKREHPSYRPGQDTTTDEPTMTVGDYMRLAGLED